MNNPEVSTSCVCFARLSSGGLGESGHQLKEQRCLFSRLFPTHTVIIDPYLHSGKIPLLDISRCPTKKVSKPSIGTCQSKVKSVCCRRHLTSKTLNVQRTLVHWFPPRLSTEFLSLPYFYFFQMLWALLSLSPQCIVWEMLDCGICWNESPKLRVTGTGSVRVHSVTQIPTRRLLDPMAARCRCLIAWFSLSRPPTKRPMKAHAKSQNCNRTSS